MKKYEIGEKVYFQDELVLCQQEELAKVIGAVTGDSVTVNGIMQKLFADGMLTRALAIVLTPDGATPAKKDVEAEEAYIRGNLKMSMQAEIVKDFFDCNAEALKGWAALGAEANAWSKKTMPQAFVN